MEYDFAEALISFREQSNFQCTKKSDTAELDHFYTYTSFPRVRLFHY